MSIKQTQGRFSGRPWMGLLYQGLEHVVFRLRVPFVDQIRKVCNAFLRAWAMLVMFWARWVTG